MHRKIGACIRPVTILTLSDLTNNRKKGKGVHTLSIASLVISEHISFITSKNNASLNFVISWKRQPNNVTWRSYNHSLIIANHYAWKICSYYPGIKLVSADSRSKNLKKKKKNVETSSLTVHTSAKLVISCRRKGMINCEKEGKKNMKKKKQNKTNKQTNTPTHTKTFRTKSAKLLFFFSLKSITAIPSTEESKSCCTCGTHLDVYIFVLSHVVIVAT